MFVGEDRRWKRFIAKRKTDAIELNVKMEIAKRHYDRKCQRMAFAKWVSWIKFHKKRQAGR